VLLRLMEGYLESNLKIEECLLSGQCRCASSRSIEQVQQGCAFNRTFQSDVFECSSSHACQLQVVKC
jgi:hypothetical protein